VRAASVFSRTNLASSIWSASLERLRGLLGSIPRWE
jgi:hypothetical protein